MTTIPMTRSHKRVYAAAGALELTSRALPKHQRLLIQVLKRIVRRQAAISRPPPDRAPPPAGSTG